MKISAILILAALAYGRAINGAFSREDSLFDDPAILDMEPWFNWRNQTLTQALRGFQRTPRIMTTVSYKWTWMAFGYWPAAWHAVNIALHLVNVVLVYNLVAIPWPAGAAAAAALFAVHPLNVSAVCYISGRAGLLATFFTLAGLALFVGGSYLLCLLSLYFAAKSKQDAPAYWILFPAFWLWLKLT
jgi:hypothetical protein